MTSDFTIAVHSLVYLAYLPGHMASSGAIAANVATNPARIRKVMSALRKAELVKTKEGTQGGYLLGKEPAKILLGDVYKAVSAKALQPHWQTGDPEHDCPVSSQAQNVMNQIFGEAEQSYIKFLNGFTVEEVLIKIKSSM